MGDSRLDFDPSIPLVRELMREYSVQLGIDLRFQNFEAELAQLPGRYARPEGRLVIAFQGSDAAGCGAVRALGAGSCEMKRLYVRPAFRGKALGRQIARALMTEAAKTGYTTIRLDTLASMGAAISLYRSLGFQPIAPYYENPIAGSVFLEAILLENATP